jgi:hypothetical protein
MRFQINLVLTDQSKKYIVATSGSISAFREDDFFVRILLRDGGVFALVVLAADDFDG